MIDTILFDWDGTLIDTAQQAFRAFQRSLEDLGVALAPETYDRIYSPNWYSMYEQLELPRDQWERADNLWLEHYAGETPQMLSGGSAALHELARRGYLLGIVTSGSRARVLRELESVELAAIFEVVICSDDVSNKKPHPEGLELALKKLRKKPECCCYVGDCPEDIEMGKRAKVFTVGIPGGYPASRRLPESGPDLVIDSISAFAEHVLLKKV